MVAAVPDGVQLGIKALGTRLELQLLMLAGSLDSAAGQRLLQPCLPLHCYALLLCLLLGGSIPLPLLAALGIILQPAKSRFWAAALSV